MRNKMIIIIMLLFTLVLIIGTSYALFTKNVEVSSQNSTYYMSSVRNYIGIYGENKNNMDLGVEYTFNVKNKGIEDARYQLYVISETDYDISKFVYTVIYNDVIISEGSLSDEFMLQRNLDLLTDEDIKVKIEVDPVEQARINERNAAIDVENQSRSADDQLEHITVNFKGKIRVNTIEYLEDHFGASIHIATNGETYYAVAYLNPVTPSKFCNPRRAYSATNNRLGCMKWYIYKQDTDNYTMILDHNTTSNVDWYTEAVNVPYEESLAKPKVDMLVTLYDWKYTPRLIEGAEIPEITGKSAWKATGNKTWYYFDTNQSDASVPAPTFDENNRSKYDWLYNNLNGCKSDPEKDWGCTEETNDEYLGSDNEIHHTWGYWTGTEFAPGEQYYHKKTQVWVVKRRAALILEKANVHGEGIRPVITVPKSIFVNSV